MPSPHAAFRIRGLDPAAFAPLYGLSAADLEARGVRRYVADAQSAFPDRVEVRDAKPGETVLLLNYTHQPADTPFRASHAIFVLEGARESYDAIGEIPTAMRRRMISLRGFADDGMLVGAELVAGAELEAAIARLFALDAVAYLHAHYAAFGCYAARVERA